MEGAHRHRTEGCLQAIRISIPRFVPYVNAQEPLPRGPDEPGRQVPARGCVVGVGAVQCRCGGSLWIAEPGFRICTRRPSAPYSGRTDAVHRTKLRNGCQLWSWGSRGARDWLEKRSSLGTNLCAFLSALGARIWRHNTKASLSFRWSWCNASWEPWCYRAWGRQRIVRDRRGARPRGSGRRRRRWHRGIAACAGRVLFHWVHI